VDTAVSFGLLRILVVGKTIDTSGNHFGFFCCILMGDSCRRFAGKNETEELNH
jgi:hypothetical protein